MGKKSHDSATGKCDICGDTEKLSIAECTCGAVLSVCEECYSQREATEGGGLLEGCPECEADEREAEDWIEASHRIERGISHSYPYSGSWS